LADAALVVHGLTHWLVGLHITARNMRVLDPSSVVWDEIAAFWLVLWLVTPVGFWAQLVAFALFHYFDAAKPGPVGWADELFHEVDAAWRKAGFGIMLDDVVAAGQFAIGLHALCWIYAERLIHKLIPINDAQRQAIALVHGQVWDFYADLTVYKGQPTPTK